MADGFEMERENRQAAERRAQFRYLRGGAVPGQQVRPDEALEMVEEHRRAREVRRGFQVLSGALPAAPAEAQPAAAVVRSRSPIILPAAVELDGRIHFGMGVKCAIRADSEGRALYEVWDIRAKEVRKSWSLNDPGTRQPQTEEFTVGSWDVTAVIRRGEIALTFFKQPPADVWFKGLRRFIERHRGGESIQLSYSILPEGIRVGFGASERWEKAG